MKRESEIHISRSQVLLIAAQLLTLVAFGMGLLFLTNTTGGTLFLFSAVGPGLVTVAVLIVAGVAFLAFHRRHSLFDYEVFEPGEIVFSQGDEGHCAYFIQRGEVEVLRTRSGIEPTVVATLREGKFFGEMALVSQEPRNATIRAKTETQLAVLGKENFLAMCKLVPSARLDIMQAVQERINKEAPVKPSRP